MSDERKPQSFPEHAAELLGNKIVRALKSSRQEYNATDALNNIANALNRIAAQLERYNDMG